MKLLLIFLSLCSVALAAPPTGANPEFSRWFQSLTDNQGKSCCGLSDGHRVTHRVSHVHGFDYEFLWNGVWYTIPNEKVVLRHDNPTGEAIAFFNEVHGMYIFCFILPAMS